MSLEISFDELKVKVTGYKGTVQEGERMTKYWIVFKREEGNDPFMMSVFFKEIIENESIQEILLKKKE